MSIRVMTKVWEKSQNKGSALLMLLAIADNANEQGVAWPAIRTLAKKVRMQRRQAQRLIRDLEESGELKTEIGGHGEHDTNRYIINLDKLSHNKGVADDAQEEIRASSEPPIRASSEATRASFHENKGVTDDARTFIEPSLKATVIRTVNSDAPNGAAHSRKPRKKGELRKATDADIREIVNYLNARTGQNYKASTDRTRKFIDDRMVDGFTTDEFKTVIDKKYAEWGHEPEDGQKDMRPFLRPETLFGTKFEGYLNQPTKTHGNGKVKKSERNVANIVMWLDKEVARGEITEQQKQNYIMTGSIDG